MMEVEMFQNERGGGGEIFDGRLFLRSESFRSFKNCLFWRQQAIFVHPCTGYCRNLRIPGRQY